MLEHPSRDIRGFERFRSFEREIAGDLGCNRPSLLVHRLLTREMESMIETRFNVSYNAFL